MLTTLRELPLKLYYDIRCLLGHHYDPLPDGRCSWCARNTT